MGFADLHAVAKTVSKAETAEDLFGVLAGSLDAQLEALTHLYRKLVTVVHPDKYTVNADADVARAAFIKATSLKTHAEAKIRAGTYGNKKVEPPAAHVDSPPIVVKTRGSEYMVGKRFAQGDLCDLYESTYRSDRVCFKIAQSAADNDLVENESRVLKKLFPAKQNRMRESTKHIRITTPEMRREADILEQEEVVYRILGYFENFRDNVRIVDREWLLKQPGTVIFEGAQGVLLDQDFGFQPHTTWSDCTFGNAHELLSGYDGDILRLGILRSYTTRHGAGPFVTEDKDFEACSKKDHNVWTDWQQSFRSGAFDLVAAKYALDVIGGVHGLVMTHLDSLTRAPHADTRHVAVCTAYRGAALEVERPARYEHQVDLTNRLRNAQPVYAPFHHQGYAESIADCLNVRLHATSWGATARDKINHALRAA